DALGVSQADLEAALKKIRPQVEKGKANCGPGKRFHREGGPGPGGPGPMGGGPHIMMRFAPAFAADLAKQLGIDKSKVEDALKSVAKKHEDEATQRRDELAQKLADKLGISVDKVKDAFADGPFGFGFGGPPGPPPPGAPGAAPGHP